VRGLAPVLQGFGLDCYAHCLGTAQIGCGVSSGECGSSGCCLEWLEWVCGVSIETDCGVSSVSTLLLDGEALLLHREAREVRVAHLWRSHLTSRTSLESTGK